MSGLILPTESILFTARTVGFPDLRSIFATSMSFAVMRGLTQRLRHANRMIESLALIDVYGRVARALLEFAEKVDFENLVLIQATSPLLQAKDLDEGFKLFDTEGTDSVLSVVRQKRFIWKADKKGFVSPVNYDVFNRPRRQDFDGYLMENGAFYITTKKDLLESKNRLSGNMKAYEMDEDTALEIDEPSDFLIIEMLFTQRR